MTDICPICHAQDMKHKMDCQNGPYTYALRKRIEKLKGLSRYKPMVHWRSQTFTGMRRESIAGHEFVESEGEWISARDLEAALQEKDT